MSLFLQGWIDQSDILVIPEAIGTEFRIGEGLRDGNEEEWKDVVGMMKRSVRHLNHDVKGYPEITQQDVDTEDNSSFLADSRIRLPCYENVEIDLMSNNNLKHIETIRPVSKVYENVPKIEPKSETLEYPTFIYKGDPASNPSSPKPLSDIPPPLIKAPTAKESKPQQKSELKKETKQPLFKRFLQLNPQEVPIKNKNKIPPHPTPRRIPTPKQPQISNNPPAHAPNEQFSYPDNLDNLSRAEVVKCFQNLGLGGYCRQDFDINGRTLTNMNAKDLENVLKMTPLDANKASRFIRGWRP